MFNPQRILVATDFSNESERALTEALDLAEKFGSEVHLLHVIKDIQECAVDYCLSDGDIRAEKDKLREEASERMNSEINRTMKGRQIPIRKEIIFGETLKVIVRYELENNINLVVTAPHRRSKKWRIMPHLTQTLVEKSGCETMVVR